MCEIGAQLKQARESRGLSLAELSSQLSLRRAVLEALENCRFDELPESALTRGYLRNYAVAVGLDPAPLLALMPPIHEVEIRPGSRPRTRRRWNLWLLVLGAVLVGIAGLWLAPTLRPDVLPETQPAVPAPARLSLRVNSQPPGAQVFLDGFLLGVAPVEAQVEAGNRVLRLELEGYRPVQQGLNLQASGTRTITLEPQPEKPAANIPAKPASNPPTTQSVVLSLSGLSWLRVTDTAGKVLYEKTAPAGTRLTFKGSVVVRAGNAAAVRIQVDGQDLGVLGKAGQVVTRTLGSSQ